MKIKKFLDWNKRFPINPVLVFPVRKLSFYTILEDWQGRCNVRKVFGHG